MGDTPLGSQPTFRPSDMEHSTKTDSSQSTATGNFEESESPRPQHGSYSQLPYSQPQSYSHQQYAAPTTREDSFNMSPLGSTLPDISYQNYIPSQRYGPASSSTLYQVPSGQQYTGTQAVHQPGSIHYMPYQGQYQTIYNQGTSPSAHLQTGHPGVSNQFYHNQSFIGQPQPSPYFMPPSQYTHQNQMLSPSAIAQYASRSGYSGEPHFQGQGQERNQVQGQQRGNEYQGVGFPIGGVAGGARNSSIASGASQSSIVRGPPRKPRQSGHAIWIGNLPPQTELMSLVAHVCKEAPGLESLFLISKSNCAFANFKDDEACNIAQAKIHDSRFQTVRLVSRLRRSSAVTPTGAVAPTGPAALSPPNPPVARTPSPGEEMKSEEVKVDVKAAIVIDTQDITPSKDKYFVVKSLTVEDLELSVRNGIWATQTHNEESLNKAYKSADNVYLIFSANKSGEYFGYARMVSKINDDPTAAIEFAPKAQAVEDPELPKAIPTPATEFTPRGRIIDDSARGTIFWEVERDDEEEEDNESSKSEGGDAPPSKAWGKPFKIEWVSTTRLPFYRTRGLRNPWNSNREVKIARDGTELETSIGRRLLSLFHRVPSPITQSMPAAVAGYQNMLPFN